MEYPDAIQFTGLVHAIVPLSMCMLDKRHFKSVGNVMNIGNKLCLLVCGLTSLTKLSIRTAAFEHRSVCATLPFQENTHFFK